MRLSLVTTSALASQTAYYGRHVTLCTAGSLPVLECLAKVLSMIGVVLATPFHASDAKKAREAAISRRTRPETIFREAKERHRLRRIKFSGLEHVREQCQLTVTVQNMKRLGKALAGISRDNPGVIKMSKILVVDDERAIADILKFNLEKQGFEVSTAYNGEDAVEKALHENPDLIILDIMLPKMDGFAVCRAIRRTSQVPILMLTAREEEIDKVVGLEMGADDYVTKPFSPRELVARVKAILRRTQPAASSEGASQITCGDLVIDLDTYEVIKKGQTLNLSYREFELLRFLASHPGQVFSRESLLNEVWGYEYYGDLRTVDVTIRRIREKIEDDPANPEYILTKRGIGYHFRKL